MLQIPLTITGGTKKVKLNNELKPYSYSGPPALNMLFPSFRINFCPDKIKDSCLIDILRYDADNLSGYKSSVAEAYAIDFGVWANRLLLSADKLNTNNTAITDLANKIPAIRRSKEPTGYQLLDEMQLKYKGKLQAHELQESISAMSLQGKYVRLFEAANHSPLMIDNNAEMSYNVNNKEIMPGNIQIKMLHSPTTN